jgi:hypothetical protein
LTFIMRVPCPSALRRPHKRGTTRMDACMKWMNANKPSIVEGGAPLGKTKRVDSNGASNTKNEIGGYSVVQAESHDAATKIFGKDHPHLQMPGAWIEIIEIMPVPGM